jgi:hypothetical protein
LSKVAPIGHAGVGFVILLLTVNKQVPVALEKLVFYGH